MSDSNSDFPDIEAVRRDLEAGETVTRLLPGGGRLHIERPQPFLCLYRRPKERDDAGTDQLLTTQASYLIALEEEQAPAKLSTLLETVLETLSASFGGVLLLEIWAAAPSAPDPETGMLIPRFRLFAPSRGVPERTLEDLETALLVPDWPTGQPDIEIVYGERTDMPSMASALATARAKEIGATMLGIEVSPAFRAPDDREVLPLVLGEMRRILGRAMKRAFYTFAHTHARYRPSHYHELGPRLLEEVGLQVDAGLTRIDDAVDLLLNVTPVNAAQAWHRFSQAKFDEKPEFHYRALRLDPNELKRELFALPVEAVDDPALHHMFSMKREELDRQISMLSDRGTDNFLPESQQVYGRPTAPLVAMARRILEEVPPLSQDETESDVVDAETFAAIADAELAYYHEQDPSFTSVTEIRSDIPGLMVSHGKFLVGAGAVVARRRIKATLQHEIGTHALTYHNGRHQPYKLLGVGLAGYEELQEGIAVLAEFLVGGLTGPRLRQIAARAEAVHQLVQGADFVDVYRLLHNEFGFNQRSAYNITMRVYRGGGFTKDAIYLRGLIGVVEYLGHGGDFEILLSGKVALDHVEIMEELRWRQILETPRLMPKYLGAEETLARTSMEKIEQSSERAIDLILESLS